MLCTCAVVAVSAAIAALRIAGVKGPIYQAAAHLWAGALVAAAAITGRGLFGWSVAVLTAIETAFFAAALARKCRR